MKITVKGSNNKLGGTTALLGKGARGKSGAHGCPTRDSLRWNDAASEIQEALDDLVAKESEAEAEDHARQEIEEENGFAEIDNDESK